MKKSVSRRWLFSIGLFLVFAPVICWLISPGAEIEYPPDDFIPDHLTAALCLRQFETAWEKHWLHRGGPAPGRALLELLDRAGAWERYEENHGPATAEKMLGAIQKAVFGVIGREAWMFLGRWQAGNNDEDELTGLVFAIRGDVAVSDKIGPLLEMMLPDVEFKTRIYRESKIYIYSARRAGQSLAFFYSRGWICGSWRQRGIEPLTRIIDRMHDGAVSPSHSAEFRNNLRPTEARIRDSGLSLLVLPQQLWPEMRKFNLQRGHGFSPKSESRVHYWQKRLDHVDRVFLYQHGPSLFDLALELTGKRPRQLALQYRPGPDNRGSGPPAGNEMIREKEKILPAMFELDLDVDLARMIAPLVGMSWADVFDDNLILETWGGDIIPVVNQTLSVDDDTTHSRIGLAAYPSSLKYLPVLLTRMNQPGQRPEMGSPGLMMSRSATSGGANGTGPIHWIRPPGAEIAVNGATDLTRWQQFTRDIWNSGDRISDAFIAFDFDGLSTLPESVPRIMLNRKTREKLKSWIRWLGILDMSCGDLVLTLDVSEERWLLRSHGYPLFTQNEGN
jgi:hypothetical protein